MFLDEKLFNLLQEGFILQGNVLSYLYKNITINITFGINDNGMFTLYHKPKTIEGSNYQITLDKDNFVREIRKIKSDCIKNIEDFLSLDRYVLISQNYDINDIPVHNIIFRAKRKD